LSLSLNLQTHIVLRSLTYAAQPHEYLSSTF
jgi:hypothetical protein